MPARARAIPVQYEPVVQNLSLAGLSLRAISERLRTEHGIVASHVAVATTLRHLRKAMRRTAPLPSALESLSEIVRDTRYLVRASDRKAAAMRRILRLRLRAVATRIGHADLATHPATRNIDPAGSEVVENVPESDPATPLTTALTPHAWRGVAGGVSNAGSTSK